MASNFRAEIDEIIAKNSELLTALTRGSVQALVNQAQTPVAKGGKMRVDTGFLRASGQMSLTGMPSGPVRGDDDAKKHQYDDGNKVVSVEILNNFKAGDTIFFGWTANYAIYREAYDGFLSSAIQNWQSIVNAEIAKLKAALS